MSAVLNTDIDRMIANYQDGYSLEQAFYISPEIFDHDMSRLVIRSPKLTKMNTHFI